MLPIGLCCLPKQGDSGENNNNNNKTQDVAGVQDAAADKQRQGCCRNDRLSELDGTLMMNKEKQWRLSSMEKRFLASLPTGHTKSLKDKFSAAKLTVFRNWVINVTEICNSFSFIKQSPLPGLTNRQREISCILKGQPCSWSSNHLIICREQILP